MTNLQYNDLLSLEFKAFDQSEASGWRRVAKKAGCRSESARLIQTYLRKNRKKLSDDQVMLLHWHAGQNFAYDNATALAIEAMQQCLRNGEHYFDVSWNHYVEGTIAFLKGDNNELRRNLDALNALSSSDQGREALIEIGITVPTDPNAEILSNLLECSKLAYKQAYACTTHSPTK